MWYNRLLLNTNGHQAPFTLKPILIIKKGWFLMTTSNDTSDQEIRHCRCCGKAFPATEEYFVLSRTTGKIERLCKACSREQRRQLRAKSQGKTLPPREQDGNYITCEICGDKLIQITLSHCQRHGITLEEYRQQFPNAPITAKELLRRLSEQAKEQWQQDYDQLVEVRRETGRRFSGPNHYKWKGGYQAGLERGTRGDKKHRSRRRTLRLHGHCCMIPGCGFDYVVHNHHIIARANGGDNSEENCILLCPNHHALADAGILSAEYLSSIVQDALDKLYNGTEEYEQNQLL